jgi:hypothetical protein
MCEIGADDVVDMTAMQEDKDCVIVKFAIGTLKSNGLVSQVAQG